MHAKPAQHGQRRLAILQQYGLGDFQLELAPRQSGQVQGILHRLHQAPALER